MRPRSPRTGENGLAAPPTVDDLLPGEAWAIYLDQIRLKVPPSIAAREAGHTGSAVKSAIRRDPERQRQFDEAYAEGEAYYREQLHAEARSRAIEGKSDRILEVELATHAGIEYAHLRRDRIAVEGRMEHALVIDPSKLALLSDSELRAFEAALGKLGDGGSVIEGEVVREIGPGADPG